MAGKVEGASESAGESFWDQLSTTRMASIQLTELAMGGSGKGGGGMATGAGGGGSRLTACAGGGGGGGGG